MEEGRAYGQGENDDTGHARKNGATPAFFATSGPTDPDGVGGGSRPTPSHTTDHLVSRMGDRPRKPAAFSPVRE